MQTTRAWETLKQFRLTAYRTLGRRKESLFERMEAVLAAPGPATLVRLSLATVFRRDWPSAPDALADGEVDADRCRALVQTMVIEPGVGGQALARAPTATPDASRPRGHELPGHCFGRGSGDPWSHVVRRCRRTRGLGGRDRG